MAHVIRASLDFRSSTERAALERLSVFAGPFDASAAQVVAACSAATLATLLRAALVQKEPGPETSYSLHPLLRETLHDAFVTAKDHQDTMDLFCAYYLAPGLLSSTPILASWIRTDMNGTAMRMPSKPISQNWRRFFPGSGRFGKPQ